MTMYKNNTNLHARAEGLSVSRLFALGYTNVSRFSCERNNYVLCAEDRRKRVRNLPDLFVVPIAFWSRSFKSKDSAIRRLLGCKNPGYILGHLAGDIDTQFWIYDKNERLFIIGYIDVVSYLDKYVEELMGISNDSD